MISDFNRRQLREMISLCFCQTCVLSSTSLRPFTFRIFFMHPIRQFYEQSMGCLTFLLNFLELAAHYKFFGKEFSYSMGLRENPLFPTTAQFENLTMHIFSWIILFFRFGCMTEYDDSNGSSKYDEKRSVLSHAFIRIIQYIFLLEDYFVLLSSWKNILFVGIYFFHVFYHVDAVLLISHQQNCHFLYFRMCTGNIQTSLEKGFRILFIHRKKEFREFYIFPHICT